MDRDELIRISKAAAQDIVTRYRKPASIEHGLAESMGEQNGLVYSFLERSSDAFAKGDDITGTLYQHMFNKAQENSQEFKGRLFSLKGLPPPGPIVIDDILISKAPEFENTVKEIGVDAAQNMNWWKFFQLMGYTDESQYPALIEQFKENFIGKLEGPSKDI